LIRFAEPIDQPLSRCSVPSSAMFDRGSVPSLCTFEVQIQFAT
jgi:hypothetical protein